MAKNLQLEVDLPAKIPPGKCIAIKTKILKSLKIFLNI